MWCVCVFCSFIRILSVSFVFHRKDTVFLNLISRYVLLQVSNFLKNNGIVYLCKVNFKSASYSFSLVQVGSCCVLITDSVNIYLYMCVSLMVPMCPVCVCLCVWYRIKVLAKTRSSAWNLSKNDALLHKIHSKLLPVLTHQDSLAK